MSNEKKFLSISVCKSNVKKDTYYGKVAFKGTVSVEELLYTLKEAAPYIDIQMVKIALEKLSNVIVDYAASGYIVNFFDLGSFSLKVKGALDVKKSGKELLSVFEKESFDSEGIVASFSGKHCDASFKDDASFKEVDESFKGTDEGRCFNYLKSECVNYDVTQALKETVSFEMKFESSKLLKNALKHVKMGIAIKRQKEVVIKEATSIKDDVIKLEGNNLKVVGERDEAGIYLKEVKSGKVIKICGENIIKNTPKEVMFFVGEPLEKGGLYKVLLLTQYDRKGLSSTIRCGAIDFSFSKGGTRGMDVWHEGANIYEESYKNDRIKEAGRGAYQKGSYKKLKDSKRLKSFFPFHKDVAHKELCKKGNYKQGRAQDKARKEIKGSLKKRKAA